MEFIDPFSPTVRDDKYIHDKFELSEQFFLVTLIDFLIEYVLDYENVSEHLEAVDCSVMAFRDLYHGYDHDLFLDHVYYFCHLDVDDHLTMTFVSFLAEVNFSFALNWNLIHYFGVLSLNHLLLHQMRLRFFVEVVPS